MAVDRCACKNITFAALKKLADEGCLGFRDLCEKSGCCQNCSMCEPYILEMLATGKTLFPVKPHHEQRSERSEGAQRQPRGKNDRGTLGG